MTNGKPKQLDPTGETVAANFKRLRDKQNLTYSEISRRLEAAGQRIPELGLRRIVQGSRQINVDELFALAFVLNVGPAYLLTPHASRPDDVHDVTAMGTATAAEIWGWIRDGALPIPADDPEKILANLKSMQNSTPLFAHSKTRDIFEEYP